MTSEDIKHQLIIIIVQELCESRGGRPELSVLTSLLVFVDVKNYWTMLWHWSQLVPNMSTRTSEDIKQHFTYLSSHLRTPSPSLISLMVSVDVKHHVYLYVRVQGGDPTRKLVPPGRKLWECSTCNGGKLDQWLFRPSPGEIKRREVSWTLTKKLAQKRSRAGRWSWAWKMDFFCSSCFPTAELRTLP